MTPLGFFKDRRRRRVGQQAFPPDWRELLQQRVRLYNRLPAADREELHRHIHVFLDEKKFEGCDGLEITDEIRLTIAASACALLLHRDTGYFPHMASIFVYPAEFYVEVEENDGGVVSEFVEDRSGESWDRGPVVISLRDALLDSTAAQPYNVIVHEFAHQLDLENGAVDGAPALDNDEQRREWTQVFTGAFTELTQRVSRGGRSKSIIDPYAAEDPAEFFAVAVECFFESPVRLRDEIPRVYEMLAAYFRQDPASW